MVTGNGSTGAGRRILIAHYDMFNAIGGGQSVYKAIIAARPNDTFYYFRRHEPAHNKRPANVVAIPWVEIYQGPDQGVTGDPGHFFWTYLECRNMAASVAQFDSGLDFDVVDVPDYSQAALFIETAFRAEAVRVGMVALAMYGNLSTAFRMGWPVRTSQARLLAEMTLREQLQFRCVDARYSMVSFFSRQWQEKIPFPVNPLDPLCVTGGARPFQPPASASAPDLLFVGRREKWKGPDLFLDLAWCVDPTLYNRLVVGGPDGPNHDGTGSDQYLAVIARNRGLTPEIPGALTPDAMQALYRKRTLVLLPSRYDTFNLVTLETVLQGCPVIVSDRAGASEWLRSTMPELPWLSIPIDCARTASGTVSDVLRNYDRRRGELLDLLTRRPPTANLDTVNAIYTPAPSVDRATRDALAEMAAWLGSLVRLAPPPLPPSPPSFSAQPAVARPAVVVAPPPAIATEQSEHVCIGRRIGRRLPAPIRIPLRARVIAFIVWRFRAQAEMDRAWQHVRWRGVRIWRDMADTLRAKVATSAPPAAIAAVPPASVFSPRSQEQIDQAMLPMPSRIAAVATRLRDYRDPKVRLEELSGMVAGGLIDRVTLFREMIRLERQRGDDLTAATYMLRIMRWLGRDVSGDLPFVVATLRNNRYAHEADAAEAMFGRADQAAERCHALMQAAWSRHLHKPDLPLAVLDDRRGADPRRVSVIVSLYNAADKLPTLLRMLAQQSIAAQGGMEVVLVDSNSPSDELGALESFLRDHRLPVVYARSAERETIQAAWNRGIGLARAPYLSFLGADEGLHPAALSRLAAELDADVTVDWAMANSVVTNVDRDGIYDSDVMPYDRTGYQQDLVYLETCYLSWVGGLYRRSIHDRFGYYDESFRAAGDSEFKNRVLPHIRTRHVPEMLGVFNNYPEERTTQHLRAEVEDLRAWYLCRSHGGMRYAFANRPTDDVTALLRTAFSYRKSYCGHISSDLDLADSLSAYLLERPDAPAWAPALRREVQGALTLVRRLELTQNPGEREPDPRSYRQQVRRTLLDLRDSGSRIQALLSLPEPSFHEIFHDNRYEQHWWSWSV